MGYPNIAERLPSIAVGAPNRVDRRNGSESISDRITSEERSIGEGPAAT